MRKKGFTLIELLVVIAIIGILSTIGLVALNGAREKARDAQRVSDLAQFRTALSLYYDDNNSMYPPQIAATAATSSDCVDNTGASTTQLMAGGAFSASGANIMTGTVTGATAKLIPTYLGNALKPPAASSSTNPTANHYCYDTNEANQFSAYVLYTQLEGGTTQYYYLDNTGANGKTATGHTTACSATTCTF